MTTPTEPNKDLAPDVRRNSDLPQGSVDELSINRPEDVPSPIDARDSGQHPTKQNESLSIDAIIDAYHMDVYRFAIHLAGNAIDAEDLTQQTFLTAQQKIHQLRDPSKSKRWLLAVCRNRFLKSLRRPTMVLESSSELTIDELTVADSEAPVDGERIRNVIGQLPDEYRAVIVMYYFEELSYREIAEELEVKLGTVMSRLSRAKGRLRNALLRETSPEED